MYILKNAMKNLVRNKGRNLLLGFIIFALILATTIALVINATSRSIIEDYKTRFGSKVTLSVDFDKLMEDVKPDENGMAAFPTAPEISPEQYIDFSKSEYLKSYQMDMMTGVSFPNLEAVGDSQSGGMVGSIGGDDSYIPPKAKIFGYSDPNNIPDFKDGLREIIEGEFYQKENGCIISSDFADLNQLKVGDTFEVMDSVTQKTVTLTVAGIYADATKATGDLPEGMVSLDGAYGNRRNEILVDLETMQGNFDVNNLIVNAEYELKSPDLLADFEEELRDKGLPASYIVNTDEAGYNKIVAPVEGLSKISITFMWIVLIVGGIILLFVTSMAIRERKYEIGVLRAMGMKKAKVATMLVAETVMITAVCLGMGLGVGNALSQPVADVLIAGQAETAQQDSGLSVQPDGSVNIGMATDTGVQPLNEIDVSLTADAATQIVFIALLLALLSSSAGVIFITRYEPMKILSERN
ncbi:MAG: ABC transporter permease [Eubacterium sp.]|nr:ABC transporter permease [Eubacterium sp.]